MSAYMAMFLLATGGTYAMGSGTALLASGIHKDSGPTQWAGIGLIGIACVCAGNLAGWVAYLLTTGGCP